MGAGLEILSINYLMIILVKISAALKSTEAS